MEIDLIRGGQSARDHRTGNWPESTYLLTVNRASNQSVAEVYGVGLREPLPAIRIPLRNGEPDAALDLQPLINRCHENGRYWTLPYRNPPVPALTDDDAQWAQGILENAELI